MTPEEKALLFAVARVLRAHLKDHEYHPGFDQIEADREALDEALLPFDPQPEHGGDFAGKDRK